MVIWCFGLSNSVYNHFVDLDKVWAPALHTFLPDPWVKMILWGTSSPTAWSFLSTNAVPRNPGAQHLLGLPRLTASLEAARWGQVPWDLHQPIPVPLPVTKACAVPAEHSAVPQLGDEWFMLLWSGVGWQQGTVSESGPHWGSQFGLLLVKWKLLPPSPP